MYYLCCSVAEGQGSTDTEIGKQLPIIAEQNIEDKNTQNMILDE